MSAIHSATPQEAEPPSGPVQSSVGRVNETGSGLDGGTNGTVPGDVQQLGTPDTSLREARSKPSAASQQQESPEPLPFSDRIEVTLR